VVAPAGMGRCQRPVTVAECRPSGPGDERRLLGEERFVELADGIRTGRRAAVWQRQDCPRLVQCHQVFDVTRAGPLDEEPPTPERLLEVATELNARPRKTLGGITPAQAMQRLLVDPETPIVATTA